jgi:hypothetical protein
MIDNPDQVERLITRLTEVLPVPARITAELAATIQAQKHPGCRKLTCPVTSISYAGDDGGIVCKLDFDDDTDEVVFTSITHLRFDPRQPLAREIVSYQKHRVKRLRQQPV